MAKIAMHLPRVSAVSVWILVKKKWMQILTTWKIEATPSSNLSYSYQFDFLNIYQMCIRNVCVYMQLMWCREFSFINKHLRREKIVTGTIRQKQEFLSLHEHLRIALPFFKTNRRTGIQVVSLSFGDFFYSFLFRFYFFPSGLCYLPSIIFLFFIAISFVCLLYLSVLLFTFFFFFQMYACLSNVPAVI